MAKDPVIIFDADGTLIDSANLHDPDSGPGRVKKIVQSMGFPIPPDIDARLKECWAYGDLHSSIIETPFGLTTEVSEEVLERWRQLDIQKPCNLIPGADRIVRMMVRVGFRTAMLTSRNRESLLATLDYHELDCFHYIFSRDDCQYKKPDCRVVNELLDCLEHAGITRKECLAVGDIPGDVKCFTEAGIEFVGVETGLYNKQDLVKAGAKPDNILPSVLNLEHWLRCRGIL